MNGTVTLAADASDNRGVAGVQFHLDGADPDAEDSSAPYSACWDTDRVGGTHAMAAIARDAAGNRTTAPRSRHRRQPGPSSSPTR